MSGRTEQDQYLTYLYENLHCLRSKFHQLLDRQC